jgi:hypothetical protein
LGEASGNALDSKDSNPGTTVAGITRNVAGLLTGDANGAAQGDGVTGHYIQVPSNVNMDTGAQLTVECWVKPAALSAAYVVARSSSSTVFFLELSGAIRWRFYVRDANLVDTDIASGAPSAPAIGTRQHLVGVYDAAGNMRLYVNGVSQGAPSRTPNANTRSGTGQALDFFAESSTQPAFNGVIDEVALYSTALTQQQVLDHYNAGLGVYVDAPTGTIVLSGSRTESWVPGPRTYTDARAGTIVLSGTPGETWTILHEWGGPVRELPPLRLHVEAATLDGKRYRWGSDEPDPQNVPSGLRFSSTMPGGFESMDCVLARKPGPAGNDADLEPLSTLRVLGPGGDVAGEYRLERTPKTSGDQMAVSPSAVGWQAHLEDNKDVKVIFIDRDLSHWTEPTANREIFLIDSGWNTRQGSMGVVQADGVLPAGLQLAATEYGPAYASGGVGAPLIEAWYYTPKLRIAFVNADYVTYDKTAGGLNTLAGTWTKVLSGMGLGTGGSVSATPNDLQAVASLSHSIAGASTPGDYRLIFRNVCVIGSHGLPLTSALPATMGVLASDAIGYAIRQWAPLLKIKPDSIQPSSFSIPQLAFLESTTVAEITRQATRFNLADWGVWEGQEFQWYERNTRGRRWRSRIAPAQLQETGQQIDRLWESVVVQYSDVDGTALTVGPPGSGATTESALLKDTDPENPANKIGVIRRDKLVMGTSTAAGAIQVGQRFLQEQKLLDRSGQARIVGHVTDDHGVLHPYWRIRAGDQISFIDASDPSPRRIVKVDHDNASKTASLDLDAPPEGLDALLERLGVSIVALGL